MLQATGAAPVGNAHKVSGHCRDNAGSGRFWIGGSLLSWIWPAL